MSESSAIKPQFRRAFWPAPPREKKDQSEKDTQVSDKEPKIWVRKGDKYA